MAKAKKTDETATPKKTLNRAKTNGGTATAPGEARSSQTMGTLTTMSMSEEQVRARAYELYLQRNGDGGTPEEDWYRAEAELRGKIA